MSKCSETVWEVTMEKKVSDILNPISIAVDDYDISNYHQSVFLPYYPGIRAKLDINMHLQGKNIKKVFLLLRFEDFDNFSVELQIDEKRWDTHRTLYINKIRQSKTL